MIRSVHVIYGVIRYDPKEDVHRCYLYWCHTWLPSQDRPLRIQLSLPSLHVALSLRTERCTDRQGHLPLIFPASPQYCAAGVLLGIPLSIHKKSYWPVAMAAAAGTAADYKEVNTYNPKRVDTGVMTCPVSYLLIRVLDGVPIYLHWQPA